MLIGISGPVGLSLEHVRAFLLSAGFGDDQVRLLGDSYEASQVRGLGGLIVHLEPDQRPTLDELSSGGLPLITGDYVLCGARHPGEYLPRLLTLLSSVTHNTNAARAQVTAPTMGQVHKLTAPSVDIKSTVSTPAVVN